MKDGAQVKGSAKNKTATIAGGRLLIAKQDASRNRSS
jgi:hypothetical protein